MLIMRRRVIDVWSKSDDPKRVDRTVASLVMPLDVIHVHGVTLIPGIWNMSFVQQIWILLYEFLVTYEVNRIHQRFTSHVFAYCVISLLQAYSAE